MRQKSSRNFWYKVDFEHCVLKQMCYQTLNQNWTYHVIILHTTAKCKKTNLSTCMITRRWQKDDKNQTRIIKRVKTQQICCYEIHQYYVKYQYYDILYRISSFVYHYTYLSIYLSRVQISVTSKYKDCKTG